MHPDRNTGAEAADVVSQQRIRDDDLLDAESAAAEPDAQRLSHFAGLLCY